MDVQTAAAVVFLAWLAVVGLLRWEHAQWKHVAFLWRYGMGLGTVCGACLVVGVVMSDLALAIVPGLLATAGMTIVKAYADEDEAQRQAQAAQKRGEVVGMARGLRQSISQEMIDRGDDPTRN